MDSTGPRYDVLVVGAGMAGLMAARELQRAGRRVVVVDKGRGVGGRLASRRIAAATFDHGAQFITTRDSRFGTLLEKARQEGATEEWCQGFSGASDGHARWRGKPAMSGLAKHLAAGLDLHLETTVTALRLMGESWRIDTANGVTFQARAVIMTPPVPQTLATLDAGGLVLDREMRSRLAAIEYERCLAVMAILEAPSRIPPPGGLAPADGPIAWMADNQLKGISGEPAVTLHATHAFSLEHWDHDRQETGRALLDAAAPWIGSGIKTFQVHGWRYSKPLHVDKERCVLAYKSPPLILAGDAFAGPRVEGAALSGWAAAETILSMESGERF